MTFTTRGLVKKAFFVITMAVTLGLNSCQDSSTSGNAGESDSVHSGLEGTRDDASQLSNATIDTSSGQNVEKTAPGKDSSGKRDSVIIK